MVITYFGMGFVKVQFGDTVLAFNPLGKDADLKGPRFGANLALVSLNHSNFNGVENLTHGDKTPFVIDGPGEYEVNGLYIKGVPSDGKDNSQLQSSKINTIYSVTMEGINLCHLGGLKTTDIKDEIAEELGEVDVLFVPIWGDDVLDPSGAEKISSQLEPRMIVPLYKSAGKGQKDVLAAFKKEMGYENGTPIEKLTLKKKDLDGKEGEVVVLEAQV